MRLQLAFVSTGDQMRVYNHLTKLAEKWTVLDNSKGQLTFQSDAGAQVTRPQSWFHPALEWDEQGEKGTSVVDWELGSLWPLEVGNRAYYHRICTLVDGTRREENWRCRVEAFEKVQIDRSGNVHDAFKVVCVSETNIHTWHWSPQFVGPIRYERSSAQDGRVLEKIEREDA